MYFALTMYIVHNENEFYHNLSVLQATLVIFFLSKEFYWDVFKYLHLLIFATLQKINFVL